MQRPGRRDPRVLLPQRAGGGVARVGERRLARLDERGVELLERLDREEDLAAHLQPGRHAVPGLATGGGLQGARDLGDGADVVGDVLPGAAVAAGRGPDQAAVLVEQVDRQPVDLELAQVAHLDAADVAPGPLGPGGDLLLAEGVVQAEHPLDVLDRREVGRVGAPDRLGRALRRPQLGVGVLQRLEVAEQPVVRRVADRRGIAQVVGEPGRLDLLGDLGPAVAGGQLIGPLIGPWIGLAGRRRRRERESSMGSPSHPAAGADISRAV